MMFLNYFKGLKVSKSVRSNEIKIKPKKIFVKKMQELIQNVSRFSNFFLKYYKKLTEKIKYPFFLRTEIGNLKKKKYKNKTFYSRSLVPKKFIT